jgi:peroxiredoxin
MARNPRAALITTSLLFVAGVALTGPALLPGLAFAAAPKASGKRLTEIPLQDPSGKTRSLAEFKGRKALALIFLGTECPIANSYAPELSALAREYEPKGVQVLGINANPDETLSQIAAQAKSYKLSFPVLKDAKQALADRVGARVTPEAFVLDADRMVRYRGRIDDRYQTRTKSGDAKVHDLRDALDAVLAGKAVQTAETRTYGCAIVRPEKTAAVGKITYHRDVEPILQQRCQSCHRPGQVAPFSLLSYKDARSWGSEIKQFTGSRQMPPWLAEPGHGEFQDVRRLSDEEVGKVAQWVDGGMPEGNRKDAPPAREWSGEWMLGKPDLVLSASEEYEVAASGDDDFRVFVLPTGVTENKQVVAIDFRPGNSRVVHHVVSFVDTTGKGRELDAASPGPGFSSGPGGVGILGASIQGVWAPGNLPRFLPTGVGRPLPKNGDLLIQVHYHKTGKVERDKTEVALYFAKDDVPITVQARTAIFGPFRIDIPADAARHEERFSMTLPLPVKVLNIMPHMHLLGREMKVTATYPDGKTENLVWIKDWDYRWQDSYRYREPLRLPRGTKVEVVAYFDNTSANPRNPSNPPRRVRFGEQTTDEMAFAIMEVVPDFGK